MPSLTPASRSAEVTDSAMREGTVNALLALCPALGGLYFAMQNPKFVKTTNWQSRTAIVIMPVLFIFSVTGEQKMAHRMKEVAEETDHARNVVKWAERQHTIKKRETNGTMTAKETENHLLDLYRRSVRESGVQIVPGDTLSMHHEAANFVAANPLKILASGAVPAVLMIFYGRTGKQHLDLSVKLMHTRVFGQFAAICMLLGVMGFKNFMDSNGKFITEAEAEERVQEMRELRDNLRKRLAIQKEKEEQFQEELREAHQHDLEKKKEKKKQKKVKNLNGEKQS